VPELDQDIDQLGYVAGKSFHEINRSALDGTVQAHAEGGVPVVKIVMDKLNAQQMGKLIYFYELFTAVYVYMLDVNPFNQPGVEAYKTAMYRLLGKT
jgi:glucose-6-phosphate isomerase